MGNRFKQKQAANPLAHLQKRFRHCKSIPPSTLKPEGAMGSCVVLEQGAHVHSALKGYPLLSVPAGFSTSSKIKVSPHAPSQMGTCKRCFAYSLTALSILILKGLPHFQSPAAATKTLVVNVRPVCRDIGLRVDARELLLLKMEHTSRFKLRLKLVACPPRSGSLTYQWLA